MRVLLDSHMLGNKETGNERYWKNISEELMKSENKDDYFRYNPETNNGLYRILFGFTNAAKSTKSDIVHVQNFSPIVKTIPIVNTVHDLCFRLYPDVYKIKTRLAFKYFFKRSLDLSDAIICVSESTKNFLIKFYKVDAKKVFVIYEAADKCFKYLKNRNILKKMLTKKFNLNNKYFLVVGNVEERKLPYAIINSFKLMEKKFPELKLIFAGPNKLKIKPTKNILVLDYVTDEELNILYNGATSLIYLSLCEGFGLPIVEAMKTKTPVICSDIPVFREITDNKAVFVKNSKELNLAMKKFILNIQDRKRYSILGYKRSMAFSWNKTVKQTIEVYKWVLKTHGF